MGRFINGDWRPNPEHETSEDDGEFNREQTTFRNRVEAAENSRACLTRERQHCSVEFISYSDCLIQRYWSETDQRLFIALRR